MSLEFLFLIGVFVIMLEQIRRLRMLVDQMKADYEARVADLEARLAAANDPTIQLALDALEADLTPTKDNPAG